MGVLSRVMKDWPHGGVSNKFRAAKQGFPTLMDRPWEGSTLLLIKRVYCTPKQRKSAWVYVLSQGVIVSLPHWLKSDLTVSQDWPILKESVWAGKERLTVPRRMRPLLQAFWWLECSSGPCVNIILPGGLRLKIWIEISPHPRWGKYKKTICISCHWHSLKCSLKKTDISMDIGSAVLGTGMWSMEKEAGFRCVELEACLGGPGGF